ncbi:ATP-binding protein [Halosegnis marinus]|uniref:hybrid sensor histidine kinase/response regulator n=1 Tax=Halosegnis marinus TaxID=3034023 RepID=UPI0036060B7D
MLCVGGDGGFAKRVAEFLRREYDDTTVETVAGAEEAWERLDAGGTDCIVSAFELPATDALAFLERVREAHPELPFLLFAEEHDEGAATEALAAGATDYVRTDRGADGEALLGNRVRNAVERRRARRRAERSDRRLDRIERRYGAIFNDPNILVGLLDADGTVLDINDTALGYVEADREAVVDAPFHEGPWFSESAETAANVRSWVERAAAGEYVEFAIDHDLPSVGVYRTEGVFRPVTDGDGEVVSIIVSARDTTEQREHERELERTNALLSTLFETLPVGVLAEDGDRNVLALNERFADLFGLDGDPETYVGADCPSLAGEAAAQFDDPAAFTAGVERLADRREPVTDEELSLADGRTFQRSYRPIELADGRGHLWVYRETTAESRREARLAALNETTRDLMAATDRDEVATIGVEAAAEVLGLEANAIHLYDDEVGGLVAAARTDGVREIVSEPPVFRPGNSIAWAVYEAGEPRVVDDVQGNPKRQNPETPIRSELFVPIDEYGILVAGSTAANDFDDGDLVLAEILARTLAAAFEQVDRGAQLRAREAELERQNERLAEFAGVISHDLRNPLGVAKGRVELAVEETDNDHLAAAERALDRMDALLDDVLTLARNGERVSDLEAVELAALCETAWNNVETGTATLAVETDRTVRADASRLQQVFENLFRNSVDHAGEEVAVTVGDLPDGFYVADDGPGIPAEKREEVFDAGYSTRTEGTGFGLSIVRGIVEAHGWRVEASESEAGGARFEVTGVETV